MGDAFKTKAVNLLWCVVLTGEAKIVSERSLGILKLILIVSERCLFGSENCSFETIITTEYLWGLGNFFAFNSQ